MSIQKSRKCKNLLFEVAVKSPVAAIITIFLVIATFWLMNRLWGFRIF